MSGAGVVDIELTLNSRRYLPRCTNCINDTSGNGGKFAAGVVDTGGAPWFENISANVWKNLSDPIAISEAWGKMINEKNQKQKISWHYPFNICSVHASEYQTKRNWKQGVPESSTWRCRLHTHSRFSCAGSSLARASQADLHPLLPPPWPRRGLLDQPRSLEFEVESGIQRPRSWVSFALTVFETRSALLSEMWTIRDRRFWVRKHLPSGTRKHFAGTTRPCRYGRVSPYKPG